jgi:hypothetical protein
LAISSQIDAVRKIQAFSENSPLEIDIPQWTQHPIALRTLLELDAQSSAKRPRRRIVVHYRDNSLTDAHIVVITY